MWIDRINAAKQTEHYTKEDCELASNFCTCALGEISGIDFKYTAGGLKPTIPQELDDLAMKFYHHVLYDEISKSEDVYNQIKEQVAALKAKGKL